MKKYYLVLFIGLLLLLVSCSNEVKIYGDLKESKIVIDEEHEAITFHTLIKNDGGSATDPLYLKLIINHEQLANVLGNEEIIFVNDLDEPQAFTIDKRNGYFITQSFYYNEDIPLDELVGAVTVIVFDEEENEVTRFTINHVTKQNA